jgi:alanine dehydrogenase
MGLYYLTEAEVQSVLTMDLAISAVEASFKKMAVEEATNIPRQRCQTDNAMLHVLPASAKTLQALGLKAYTTGKFDAQFYLFLFDPNKGGLTAIVEADHLGAMRTGASSGVATSKLAREDSSTVGLFGTGKQARTQLAAVTKVRHIKSVDVYGRDVAKREQFAKEMSAVLGIEVNPANTAEQTARDKDIVITATTSRDPVLHGEWLRAGTHLNIMGSNHLTKAEVDVATITHCPGPGRVWRLQTSPRRKQAALEQREGTGPAARRSLPGPGEGFGHHHVQIAGPRHPGHRRGRARGGVGQATRAGANSGYLKLRFPSSGNLTKYTHD